MSTSTVLRTILARTDLRFALAGLALLACAVGAQGPSSRLWARSRLENSIFVAGGDAERQMLARASFGMYLPHRRWLVVASLGNGPLAADAVWIKAAGYVTREWGAAYKTYKFEWLKKLYTTVLDLDPRWSHAAHIGAMLLGAVRQDPASAVRILHRSMMVNGDDWQLPYQAGVTCLLWPGHAAQALTYFKEAVRRPGHPPILEQTIPRLMSEAGNLDEAVNHARRRFSMGGMPALRAGTANQLAEFVARQLEGDLRDAVERFRASQGRLPARLEDLRAAGPFLVRFDIHFAEETVLFDREHARFLALATGIPGGAPAPSLVELASRGFINAAVLAGLAPPPELTDPYLKPFLYHAPTGTVRSEGLAILETARTAAILRAVGNTYRRGEGKPAESLDALAAWFAARVAAGRTFPQDWSQRLSPGTPPEHPLAAWGERYAYDPATGSVSIPDRYDTVPRPRRSIETLP